MAATNQLLNFLWAQKLKKLKSEMIQVLLLRSPRYGYVQVVFSSFLEIGRH